MMNLIIDSGNTLIKTAVYDRSDLVVLETRNGWSAGEILALIGRYPDIGACLVCSTREIPVWLPELICGQMIRYHEMSHQLPLPVQIGYETPETLGTDRIAAAAGAAERYPGKNVLIVDAGTALTLDVVSAAGVFLGGNISPGLRMRFTALHQQTHSLPKVELAGEVPLFGKNTREAILAGVVNGIIYEITNSISSLHNKFDNLHVILTGGDAGYLSPRLKNTIFTDENLVLNGLNAILRNLSIQVKK